MSFSWHSFAFFTSLLNMKIKQFIIKAHMFLGLISGVIIFIVSITGALYVFKTEIESLTQDYRKVESENKEVIPPSKALQIAEAVNANKSIHGVIYGKSNEALEVIYYQAKPQYYYGAAYLNPYSGEVLKVKDFVKSFFGFMLHGHVALWLPLKIGMPIIAISAVVFLIMLITGLVLWWPKKLSSTGRFTFTKLAKPSVKRLEFHKVVAFYVMWFALILVLTGMIWVFKGFGIAVYTAMGGKKDITFSIPSSDITKINATIFNQEPIDIVWNRIRETYPDIPSVEIHAVKDSTSSILVELNRDPSTYWKRDYLFFDQYTLKEIKPQHVYGRFEEAGFPEKVRRLNYDMHTGSIWGILGKILAFIVSLFCASLPITGFMLWWNRRKEKKDFLKKLDI